MDDEAFDALKQASTVPVLQHSVFCKEFILSLGTILLQQGRVGKVHVIAYSSHSLCLSKRSMHNYGSAKLELLA